ncbi:DUF5134 domain-containing protein [Actinacidiphila sp. bgisy144]|uniref:DUF5134 domain-containing protein n=1 Tax=Actinacidiphila sp. bgisy144 TaxID=3413791 RepID=UPI003EBAD211
MGEPLLVAWLLVALSAASAASCLARAKDRGEAVMGAGMAVMAVPASVLDPHRWVAPVFAVVYAAAALRALLPGTHATGHRVHHVVCSAAMVYMAVAMAQAPPGDGHAMAMGGAGTPAATGLLLAYFAAYVLRAGVRLAFPPLPATGTLIPGVPGTSGAPGPGGGASGPVPLRHSAEVAAACRVSMALGMLVMLLLL